MYDLHPDLLLWLEHARQYELQRKVARQALLRQAHNQLCKDFSIISCACG